MNGGISIAERAVVAQRGATSVAEPVTVNGRAERLGDTLMRANSIARAPAF